MQIELGVTPDEVSDREVDLLRDFVAYLAPPPRGHIGSDEKEGERLFQTSGCTSCHVPGLKIEATDLASSTGQSTGNDSEHRTLFPYSDFLLHDMGPALDDGIPLGLAASSEFRTTPLWGLRFRRYLLLHDARARSYEQAILFHGGEAGSARDLYLTLSARKRKMLHAFLDSL